MSVCDNGKYLCVFFYMGERKNEWTNGLQEITTFYPKQKVFLVG
jgi:hypothetical protein